MLQINDTLALDLFLDSLTGFFAMSAAAQSAQQIWLPPADATARPMHSCGKVRASNILADRNRRVLHYFIRSSRF
jgi:hypothetical protein